MDWDNREIYLEPGELITAGDTEIEHHISSIYEFVRVLFPRHCYINRVHFNEGSLYLQRIA